MQKQTTGATVSRLGVLTCLAYNFVEENHLDADERRETIEEIRATYDGLRGVGASKIVARTMERSVAGVFN